MRVRVRHELVHTLKKGTRTAIATIRVTPRNHEGQYVQRWALDVQPDTRMHPHEDAFGNLTHTFTVEAPGAEIVLVAAGEVDTQDTTGIVRGTVERFPPTLFLRPTLSTTVTPEVGAFARLVLDAAGDELGRLHALMSIINAEVKEEPRLVGTAAASAADALKAKTACAGGLTHLFVASAQHLGIPARHVGGYVADEDGEGFAREWAEAFVPKIGWIAFDCGRSVCATERYVRVSAGLDSSGVDMLKGIGETTRQDVKVQEARPGKARASQSQRQQ
ncbi:MAG: hypothetical protein B7Y84_05225 [Azorhizobium sp. 32-67-21]|nr:MAG: hypothetical protein B7Z30_01110 [Rhizobiales bacterium 12-68-15]OYX89417.1 MAG: hypothetical protein B7Y84_05225 [Azorhizobium sp. 32-67-21]